MILRTRPHSKSWLPEKVTASSRSLRAVRGIICLHRRCGSRRRQVAKARRDAPMGQSCLQEVQRILQTEENYKQGIVVLGGFRGGLNPLARNKGGSARGFDGPLPRLPFLHEQHLFHIFGNMSRQASRKVLLFSPQAPMVQHQPGVRLIPAKKGCSLIVPW